MRGEARARWEAVQLRRWAEAPAWWRAVPAFRLKDLVPGERAGVALTFDDGPDPVTTPALLDLLARRGARATFFVCGAAAQRHPDLVRAAAAAGHAIGAHTWDHRPLPHQAAAELSVQLDRTHDLLADLTGAPVRHFRPPHGSTTRAARRRLRAAGIAEVLWSALGWDWAERDPRRIAGRVARDLEPGAIVLLHDACGDLLVPGASLPPGADPDRSPTVAATDLLLDVLEERGLPAVALPPPSPAQPAWSSPRPLPGPRPSMVQPWMSRSSDRPS